MYRYLDKLLAGAKKKLRSEFNRLGVMGFDELNVVNTRKYTEEMFERLLAENESVYLKVAKDAYKKGAKAAKEAGFSGEETKIDGSWVATLLAGYNLVTGYLYNKEAERKRLRLNEQILTAREFDNRPLLNDSIRRTANLWWTQTSQYGISAVDKAVITAFKDMGVERVQWVAAEDEKKCEVCGARDGKIYEILKIPEKPHYRCRCIIVPVVEVEE